MSVLKQLTDLKFPNLVQYEQDQIIDEIISIIQNNPEWDKKFDGVAFQDSTFMILAFLSYMKNKNAISFNKLIRETFLTEAINPENIVNKLTEKSLSIQQNGHSSVEVIAEITNDYNINDKLIIPPFTKVPAIDRNGSSINFEFINYNKETGKFNYKDYIIVEPASLLRRKFSAMVYSGETFLQTYELNDDTISNFIINLNTKDIIQDSIRVYYEDDIELIETDTFVVNPVNPPIKYSNHFKGSLPHYFIKYGAEGNAQLIFGSEGFGGEFKNPTGRRIYVYGRTGGGASSNITKGSINSTISIDSAGQRSANLFVFNFDNGFGGVDRENVYQAQYYAPYRSGQSKTIINDERALVEMKDKVNKIKVVSAKYNQEIEVPILHSFNYIAPIRDLNLFNIPAPITNETFTEYKNRFERYLNSFLKVVGSHDEEIKDEFVTAFVGNNTLGYDFQEKLFTGFPMNGTLEINAYDKQLSLIDQISFSDNYTFGVVTADKFTNQAIAVSTLDSNDTYSSENTNNVFKLKIDKLPNILVVTFNFPTTYNLNQIAEELDSQIKTKLATLESVYYTQHSDHTFAVVSDGKLQIVSPNTSFNSEIQILDGTANSALGFRTNYYYLPSPSSGRVFKQDCSYDNNTFTVDYKIVTDELEREVDYPISVNQNSGNATGPFIDLEFLNRNKNGTDELIPSTDIRIEAYDSSNGLIDVIKFNNILSSSINGANFDLSNPIPEKRSSQNLFITSESNFDWNVSKALLQLTDGVNGSISANPIISDNLDNLLQTTYNYTNSNSDTVSSLATITGTGVTSYNQPTLAFLNGDEIVRGSVLLKINGTVYASDNKPSSGNGVLENTTSVSKSSNFFNVNSSTIDYENTQFAFNIDWDNTEFYPANPTIQLAYKYYTNYSQSVSLGNTSGISGIETYSKNDTTTISGRILDRSVSSGTLELYIGTTLHARDNAAAVGNGEFNVINSTSNFAINNSKIDYDAGYWEIEFTYDDTGVSQPIRIDFVEQEISTEVSDNSAITLSGTGVNTYTIPVTAFPNAGAGIRRGSLELLIDGETYAKDSIGTIGNGTLTATKNNYKFEIVSSSIDYYYNSPTFAVEFKIDNTEFNPIDRNVSLQYSYETASGETLSFTIDNINYGHTISGTDLFTQLYYIIKNDTSHPDYVADWANYDNFSKAWVYSFNELVTGLNLSFSSGQWQETGTSEIYTDANRIYWKSPTSGVSSSILVNSMSKVKQTSELENGQNTTDYVANQYVENLDHVKVFYDKKNYNFITSTYRPDPYFPQNEGFELIKELKNTSKKLKGFEPLIKNCEFKPLGLKIKLLVKKGYSPLSLEQEVREFILTNMTYNNNLEYVNIGYGFNLNFIKTTLMENIKGLLDIEFINPNKNIIDTTSENKQYYFILNESVISALEDFQTDYPDIMSKMINEYKIDITSEIVL